MGNGNSACCPHNVAYSLCAGSATLVPVFLDLQHKEQKGCFSEPHFWSVSVWFQGFRKIIFYEDVKWPTDDSWHGCAYMLMLDLTSAFDFDRHHWGFSACDCKCRNPQTGFHVSSCLFTMHYFLTVPSGSCLLHGLLIHIWPLSHIVFFFSCTVQSFHFQY